MDIPQFISLHVDGYLCRLQFWIISRAAVNIHKQVVVRTNALIFLDKYLGVAWLDHNGKCMFNF